MVPSKVKAVGVAAIMCARLGWAQAALPTTHTGPWQRGEPPEGWTFTGLGLDLAPDYDGVDDGAAKLDTTGDSIAVHYDDSATEVTYWVKGLTFSGGVFRVEESVDGLDWTPLQTDTALPTNATFRTNTPSAAARHVRFLYTEKVTGNVGLDGITVARIEDFIQPVIGTFVLAGGVATATVIETAVGRTYAREQTPAPAAAPPVMWTQVDARAGTGGALDLQDAAPTNVVRFYRVRDATP